MGTPSVRLAICAAGEIWGGVERFIVTMAAGVRAAGIDPVVVLFHDGPLAAALRDDGIAVVVLDRYRRHDPRLVGRVRALLRQHAINLLHVHGYKASIVGGLAARGLGVKVVKTEHGRLEPWAGWRALRQHAKLAANTLAERAVSRCLIDAQVFVSRDLQQRLQFRGSRITQRLIYNGIDPRPLPRPGGAPAAGDRRHFDLGIVGRIDKVKGHDVLLQALQRLRHLETLRLHVFGTGPLEETCRRMVRDRHLSATVCFHGFAAAVHGPLAALDVLIIPSRHEGLPYVLLEAMYLKVPVIASRVGGLREVLEEPGCAVLVDAEDPASLAAAIERLHGSRELRAQLAERAHAVVRRQYLADDMVRQYRDLYRQLVLD